MKANTFLSKLLDKTEVANKSELEQKIQSLTQDIPDEFEALLPLLMSEQAARSNPNISEYHHKNLKQDLTRAQTAKLQGAGFNEVEINEIIALPIETRTERIIQLIQSKEGTKYSQNESERVRTLEAQVRSERERADQLQASYAGREDNTKHAVEQVELRHQVNGIINGFQLTQDGLPRDRKVKVIMDELNAQIDGLGAKMILVGGKPKLVQSRDNTLNYYDSHNNPVDAQRFIEKVIMDLNLLEKRKPVGEVKVYNSFAYKTPTNSNEAFKGKVNQILGA